MLPFPVVSILVFFHFFKITLTRIISYYDLYDWTVGLIYKNNHTRLLKAWGDPVPLDRTVLNWFHELLQGNFSVEDAAPRPKRSRAIIDNYSHSTYQEIENTVGISSTAVNSIITDYFKLCKVCTKL